MAYFESFDDGDAGFFDVYAFSLVDPDDSYGKLKEFETGTEAIEYCFRTLKASPDRFVSSGLIQKEYEFYYNYTI